MTKLGLLYDRLIVQPSPEYPAYYMMVKKLLKETKAEFPHNSVHDFGDKKYEEWFERWFGVGEKNDKI